MKLLGIDTTGSLASVVIENETNIYYETDTNEVTHSEKLLPLIHKTLTKSNLTINDIEVLAVTNGPGSFTGCRIGVATIKALAHPNKINIMAISSLELLAYQAFLKLNVNDINICAMLDARNNRVYYSVYNIKRENNKITIKLLHEISNEEFKVMLDELNFFNDLVFIGDCTTKFASEITNIKSFDILKEDIIPEAKYLAEYYKEVNLIQDKMYNTFNLDVVYARVSQAERYKNEHK
ncbi:MAG: tRNA (adenosine(37)-N6)-threonylcarbamoyltransferase complex dimerization subunit type 1 TsaB [Clostridia bacterium]